MPLYKVELVEERHSFAIVRAASNEAARRIVDAACHDGDCDGLMADAPVADLYPCTVNEIDSVPEGYEIDFDANDGVDMEG